MAEMSSGESLYIVSQAQCQYYYSTIDYTNPPPFHPGFLFWVKELAAPNVTKADIIKFIKYYGTHFLTEVTFGAKFIKKHKLSQKAYQSMKNEKLSVEVQASYSGAFSVQGGFVMSKETLQAVSKFQQSVETSTITVGAAPPSNGEAMTWAASVKDNPVPTLYTLSEIHNLFSGQFIKGLPANVNLTVVRERLRTVGKDYCRELMHEGQVDSCEDNILFGNTFRDVVIHESGTHVIINQQPLMISIVYHGFDLVPRSRFGGSRTKKGEGVGKGEEETRSGKIRLRGPESGPRVNCACSKSDLLIMCTVQSSSSTTRCVLLLKT